MKGGGGGGGGGGGAGGVEEDTGQGAKSECVKESEVVVGDGDQGWEGRGTEGSGSVEGVEEG